MSPAIHSLPLGVARAVFSRSARFCDNLPQLMESWRMLLSRNAQTIYPSHGGSFSPGVMRRAVS